MAYSELLCTDLASVEGAIALGADRIELCAALELGGVTPGPGLLRRALQARDRAASTAKRTEVVVLTRPRRGDFILDEGYFEALLLDVRQAREWGADGVALGLLTREGLVDRPQTARLMADAGSMKVTFHRAFDQLQDRGAGVAALLDLGVDRLLTSGGASSAWEGREALRTLVEGLRGSMEVVAAGGVTGRSAAALLGATRVPAIHGSCSAAVGTGADRGSVGPALGKPGAPADHERLTLDRDCAQRFVEAAAAAPS